MESNFKSSKKDSIKMKLFIENGLIIIKNNLGNYIDMPEKFK